MEATGPVRGESDGENVIDQEATRGDVSDELEAMSRCYEVLKALPEGSKDLVLEWLSNRFEAEQGR